MPDEAVGRSAQELATWLAEHPELDASNPGPVTVGGLDGFEVEIAMAPESTNSPAVCPSEEVCVDLFAPPHLGFAWRLFTRGDRARMILLATADGAGTLLIAVDPYEHLGTDLETFDTLAEPLLDSIDFAASEPEPAAASVGRPRILPWPIATGSVHVRRVPTIVQLHGSPTRSRRASSVADDVPVRIDPGRADRGHRHRRRALDRGADGGRPILSVAHGTTGIADQCAPSHDPASDLAAQARYVNAGYLVAVTDYEGLGTPGRHPYLVGESEGRSVLDAAKAARQLPGAEAGDQLAIWGHSQGGHAALWAAQLAARWAPELELIGTVAAGVPADLTATGETLESRPGEGIHLPDDRRIRRRLPRAEASSVLTPAGEAALGIVDEQCAEEVLAHFADTDPAELLQPSTRSKHGPPCSTRTTPARPTSTHPSW